MLLHPSNEDISVGYVFPQQLVDLPRDSHARNMELKSKFRHHIKNCLFMISVAPIKSATLCPLRMRGICRCHVAVSC